MRLMSRAMYAQISAQNSRFSNFHLEDSVVEELVFWQSNLDHLNGRRIWFNPVQSEVPIRMLVTPDMAVTLMILRLRWPRKVFGRLI